MQDAQPTDDFVQAMYTERRAWQAVARHLPGTPDHDPDLWNAWVAAARQLVTAPRTETQSDGPMSFCTRQPDSSKDAP